MNQIILQDDIFLNKKDLKAGYVYIKKEGILLLYKLAGKTPNL